MPGGNGATGRDGWHDERKLASWTELARLAVKLARQVEKLARTLTRRHGEAGMIWQQVLIARLTKLAGAGSAADEAGRRWLRLARTAARRWSCRLRELNAGDEGVGRGWSCRSGKLSRQLLTRRCR